VKTNDLTPIPVPCRERCRALRVYLLPALAYLLSIGVLAALWRQRVAAVTLVGQAEPLQVQVNADRPGVLADITVGRFQQVAAGDSIGQLLVTDPQVLACSLDVIRAEIDLLRVDRKGQVQRQRAATDCTQLRMDWLNHRVHLASARVDLGLAEADLRRKADLLGKGVETQQCVERAQADRDRWQQRVEELQRLVAQVGQTIQDQPVAASDERSAAEEEELRAAIGVQEAKLRLAESQSSPIDLRAPIAGVVCTVYRHSGEAVKAGETIVTITAAQPTHIVGYVRQPPALRVTPGTQVEVRTRGVPRQAGAARVVEVGTQYETVPAVLQTPQRAPEAVLGLAVEISVPPGLGIRPGELVDISLTERSTQ
jgi:multidrug resistance efflux pump